MATIDYNQPSVDDDTENRSEQPTLNRMLSLQVKSELGFKKDEDKIKNLEKIKKFKNEKNLASHIKPSMPKLEKKQPQMGSRQGTQNKLLNSTTMNKESRTGDDGLS